MCCLLGVTLLLSLCEIFGGSRAFLDWPVSVRRRISVERKKAPDFIQLQLLPSSSLGRVGACFKLAWGGREAAGTPGTSSLQLCPLPSSALLALQDDCTVCPEASSLCHLPTRVTKSAFFPSNNVLLCTVRDTVSLLPTPVLSSREKVLESFRGRSSCGTVLLLCRWRLSRADSCLTGQLVGFLKVAPMEHVSSLLRIKAFPAGSFWFSPPGS